MNQNEFRSSHPSSAQIEILVEFMERNPELATGHLRSQNARMQSRRLWEQLKVRLNSLGGTTKSYKQWTKYWSDKKSAIKKKVAARSTIRRRTGGGLEREDEVVVLSELEERIVALCGGEGFSTGDTHLAIQPFRENTPSPSREHEAIQHAVSDNANLPQHDSPTAQEESAITFLDPEPIAENRPLTARRLFDSTSVATQSILHDFQPLQSGPETDAHNYRPSLSPPPATLSHTPTPLTIPTPSPSRHGSTIQVSRRRIGRSSSPRHATHAHRGSNPASASRRPSTTTHAARASRGAASLSSRPALPGALPPSQRRTEFASITERFLRVEEEQLEIQRSNARLLQSFFERNAENQSILAAAVAAVGKGLEALAEAVRRNQQ